ncbi:hypothetical protein BN1356_02308 [Streptococcus varani]|uniref:Uncharacterized protein n=1 Tax=Streptococcus varani TaxID=1608583 RepID=A0A0E3WFR0_9STRE|nr:hypothetical protein [Streptococcus varani]CQR25962.1 hypothetical protein BN1356_02308 [Streptococcus varani]
MARKKTEETTEEVVEKQEVTEETTEEVVETVSVKKQDTLKKSIRRRRAAF